MDMTSIQRHACRGSLCFGGFVAVPLNEEALEYYLNFGQNPGDFMDMHDDDQGDGDDDDEDNEPKSKAPKKKEQKKDGGAEGGEEQKQECKQQ